MFHAEEFDDCLFISTCSAQFSNQFSCSILLFLLFLARQYLRNFEGCTDTGLQLPMGGNKRSAGHGSMFLIWITPVIAENSSVLCHVYKANTLLSFNSFHVKRASNLLTS